MYMIDISLFAILFCSKKCMNNLIFSLLIISKMPKWWWMQNQHTHSLLFLNSQSPRYKTWGASSIQQAHRILGWLCNQLGCKETGRSCCSSCKRWGSRAGRGRGDRGRRGGTAGWARRRGRREWSGRKEQQQLLKIRLVGRTQRGRILKVELCYQQARWAEDQDRN